MILRFLTAFIFCTAFVSPDPSSDWISWKTSSRLTWSDFKGSPPPEATNAALTSSGISLNYSSGSSFSYQIDCHFDQQKSWGRVRNAAILAHEQGHFDLSEIYARQLNKALRQYRYEPATVSRDVDAIYQEVMKDLQEKQYEYDRLTDHSRNEVNQQRWLTAIREQLRATEKFADYKGK